MHPHENSAYTSSAQGSRREVTLAGHVVSEHSGVGFFGIQAQNMVTTGLQVVVHVQCCPHTRHVVIVLSDTHGYAPELTTAVVLVEQQSVPARSEEHTSELQSRPHLVCRL